MSDYLTAKQVIDLLKIDRTTLYRMLKEERIKGVKIGSQWRFQRKQIDVIVNHDPQNNDFETSRDILPLHCIEPFQDVFSDMAQVAVITIDAESIPLTGFSNSCRFCEMIFSSGKGRQGCIDSWKNLGLKSCQADIFIKCHAGLNCAGANISLDNKKIAMLIAGQYHTDKPSMETEEARVIKLAVELGLDPAELWDAAQMITVLDDRMKQFIGKWLEKAANAFERIAKERKELMNRLKDIAEISTVYLQN